jgi:hypothetical protein
VKTLARQRDHAEILQRLRLVQPESARRWGRMSVHQMVCHLNDSFRVMTGERTASPAAGLLQRTIVKWVALYVPLRWPAGIRTRPEIDQEQGGTVPADFESDIAQLKALLEFVPANAARFDGHLHPIFGRMSEVDWLRWAYLHTDHHFRQFGA